MSTVLSRFASVLSFGAIFAAHALAANNPKVSVRPQSRITQKIDATKLAVLANSHPARVAGLADIGRVSSATPMTHMLLVLKSSDEQEFALRGLLDEQQDKSTGNYHQWMTPDTFGATFGVASADIAKVTTWLGSQGFTVNSVAKGARIIDFSGTAGQVESAFHTEMHNYQVNGEVRSSNSTDISLPAALTDVVLGPARLNNFRLRSHMVNPRKVLIGQNGQTAEVRTNSSGKPEFTAGSGAHYVGAGDLATIFNTTPLLKAGVNGTGVKIGVLGETDILLSDVQTYRRMFGLPNNDPNFVRIGGDPGTNGDDGESALDVELSGGVAPGATIDFITGDLSWYGGGIDTAGLYAVENNSDDILSLSYGACESAIGSSNAYYNELWEQAASQGQTVFVSTGDSGPAGCDNENTESYATQGYAVNGLGSTPFNVAVGGTMFFEGTAGNAAYWNATNPSNYSTALSYIPEIPWNEGLFDVYGTYSSSNPDGGFGGIVGGSSGVSSYYQTPSWQTGPGVPTADPAGIVTKPVVAGPHRYMPDVSLEASADHDGTIYCNEGSCELDNNGNVIGAGVVGGTSVAAPSMAGVQALINQKNGGRQGLANYYYYRVAAVQSTTNCVSSSYTTSTTTTCGFHDIQTGNNNIPTNAAGTTQIGFSAGPSYDLAVGLGSPDVANLANAWSAVTFNATKTTLAVTPTTSAHGATYNVTINVNPVSGSGFPTGDVSIIAQAVYGGVGFYTLSGSSNTITGTLTGLPGGTYNVYAHYAGDKTYGGSNSASTLVTVGTENSTSVVASYTISASALRASTTFTYGANVFLQAGVAPATSGIGTPSGNITFALNNGTNLTPYTTNLDPGPYDPQIGSTTYPAQAFFDAGIGLATYDIPSTYPVLSPGTYTATVTYAGDTTFNSSTSTPISFTVTQAATTLALRSSATEIASGATVQLTATVTTLAPANGGVPATGTVTFTDTTTNTVLGTGTLTKGAVTISTTAITTSGAHSVTAAYAGDTNYGAKTSTATTVTVGGAASTTTLAASTNKSQVLGPVTFTATVPVSTANATVVFYDGTAVLGTATVAKGATTGALTVVSLTAGTHAVTAAWTGSTTLDSSTSVAQTVVVSQNSDSLQLTTQNASATGKTVGMNANFAFSPANINAANSAYVTPNPALTGAVTFLDGTTALGTAAPVYLPGGSTTLLATFNTAALKPGNHSITASYAGDANYTSATSAATTVGVGLTTTTLAAPTGAGIGVPFTVSATVKANVANTPAISGTVTFYDGTTVLGNAAVTVGQATLTNVIVTSLGTHTITAVYSGDTNYYTSTSTNTVTLTAVQPGFTLTASPTSITVVRGSAGGSTTITGTSVGNYNATLELGCSGLPNGALCIFSQTGMTFDGTNNIVPVTLTVLAPAPAASVRVSHSGLLWVPAILLAILLTTRRKQFSRRAQQLVLLVIALLGMMTVSGCGSGGSAGTPPGTYTLVVTGAPIQTGTGSPSARVTTNVSVNIQ